MLISEIYCSRQGEGLLTGTPSVFVRASGCNLRCWFCDTPYTSWQPEGEDWAVEAVVEEVERLAALAEVPLPFGEGGSRSEQGEGHSAASRICAPLAPALSQRERGQSIRHAVITGGEPMLFAEMIPLCQRLRASGWHITIETAGTLFLPVECDLMSISPKLSSSTPTEAQAGRWTARHEQTRHRPAVIRRLTSEYGYQLKFVIDTPANADEVNSWLREFPHLERHRVLLMPQGIELNGLAQIGQWLEPYCREQGFVFCPRRHIEWYGSRRGT